MQPNVKKKLSGKGLVKPFVQRYDEKLEATDGLPRGMPYLALSEDQIDELIAYLLERK